MPRLRQFPAALLLLVATSVATCAHAQLNPDWTTPVAPFRIADTVFYVGSRDLAAYLIVTPRGNILVNANLETSPPQLRASIETLGFHWADIKILLNGQAHYDHMAGAAEVLRQTHALNFVMEGDAPSVESGGLTDFTHGMDGMRSFPPTHVDRVLQDGDTVALGGVVLTAHKTAGHSRGCTTWTLRAHIPGEPAGTLRDVVIVGGWAPLSEYRLVATPGHPASYPGIAADFRDTFRTLHALPCDIFLGSHGVYFGLLGKLARASVAGPSAPSVWLDPAGYQSAVAAAEKSYLANFAKQQAAATAK
jgi:metallo-beta-lactamase class B